MLNKMRMNVFTHGYYKKSLTGPNSFTRNVFRYLEVAGVHIIPSRQFCDIEYCLIQEDYPKDPKIPRIQRLDGIYFNTNSDIPYQKSNEMIKRTYESSDAVVFQTEFNKKLTEHFFGEHPNGRVIVNGADLQELLLIPKFDFTRTPIGDREVWSCASFWRPHKRIDENIKYFLEFAPKDACLVIAGPELTKSIKDVDLLKKHINKRIFYLGFLDRASLLSVYKRSTHFIHLAYLDHCPNVVVDAQACGAKIICASSGGTKEIVHNGIVVKDRDWDFTPHDVYNPPVLDFANTTVISDKNKEKYHIGISAQKYYIAMAELFYNRYPEKFIKNSEEINESLQKDNNEGKTNE